MNELKSIEYMETVPIVKAKHLIVKTLESRVLFFSFFLNIKKTSLGHTAFSTSKKDMNIKKQPKKDQKPKTNKNAINMIQRKNNKHTKKTI